MPMRRRRADPREIEISIKKNDDASEIDAPQQLDHRQAIAINTPTSIHTLKKQ